MVFLTIMLLWVENAQTAKRYVSNITGGGLLNLTEYLFYLGISRLFLIKQQQPRNAILINPTRGLWISRSFSNQDLCQEITQCEQCVAVNGSSSHSTGNNKKHTPVTTPAISLFDWRFLGS